MLLSFRARGRLLWDLAAAAKRWSIFHLQSDWFLTMATVCAKRCQHFLLFQKWALDEVLICSPGPSLHPRVLKNVGARRKRLRHFLRHHHWTQKDAAKYPSRRLPLARSLRRCVSAALQKLAIGH